MFVRYFPLAFPLFFVGMWVAVGTWLAVMSGWFSLARAFPDRMEDPVFRLAWQSGSMGANVNMRGILTLAVCPSGLRVGIFRVFGPFSKTFFVPWDQIRIERKTVFFMHMAVLSFGSPRVGNLTLRVAVAERLARALPDKWPEPSSLIPTNPRNRALDILKGWAIQTTFAATFFLVAPRLIAHNATAFPPPAVAILFPAIVLGVASLIRYVVERDR